MTEPTPREVREGITTKLAGMPAGVDAHGRSNLDRQVDADRAARFAEAQTPAVVEGPEAPVRVGMKPNPAQGGSAGGIVPAPAPTDPLAAIRARAAIHTEF